MDDGWRYVNVAFCCAPIQLSHQLHQETQAGDSIAASNPASGPWKWAGDIEYAHVLWVVASCSLSHWEKHQVVAVLHSFTHYTFCWLSWYILIFIALAKQVILSLAHRLTRLTRLHQGPHPWPGSAAANLCSCCTFRQHHWNGKTAVAQWQLWDKRQFWSILYAWSGSWPWKLI